jgi:hypothetical protein
VRTRGLRRRLVDPGHEADLVERRHAHDERTEHAHDLGPGHADHDVAARTHHDRPDHADHPTGVERGDLG